MYSRPLEVTISNFSNTFLKTSHVSIDIVNHIILPYLSYTDTCSLRMVNKHFYKICNDISSHIKIESKRLVLIGYRYFQSELSMLLLKTPLKDCFHMFVDLETYYIDNEVYKEIFYYDTTKNIKTINVYNNKRRCRSISYYENGNILQEIFSTKEYTRLINYDQTGNEIQNFNFKWIQNVPYDHYTNFEEELDSIDNYNIVELKTINYVSHLVLDGVYIDKNYKNYVYKNGKASKVNIVSILKCIKDHMKRDILFARV